MGSFFRALASLVDEKGKLWLTPSQIRISEESGESRQETEAVVAEVRIEGKKEVSTAV